MNAISIPVRVQYNNDTVKVSTAGRLVAEGSETKFHVFAQNVQNVAIGEIAERHEGHRRILDFMA